MPDSQDEDILRCFQQRMVQIFVAISILVRVGAAGYMALATVTTIGYGEVRPLNVSGRMSFNPPADTKIIAGDHPIVMSQPVQLRRLGELMGELMEEKVA